MIIFYIVFKKCFTKSKPKMLSSPTHLIAFYKNVVELVQNSDQLKSLINP